MDTGMKDLKQEELEQASGGTIGSNSYKDHEYAAVGIECVHHLIARDEFFWRGEDIGHECANAVLDYCRHHNGQQPASVKEALDWRIQKSSGELDLLHLVSH